MSPIKKSYIIWIVLLVVTLAVMGVTSIWLLYAMSNKLTNSGSTLFYVLLSLFIVSIGGFIALVVIRVKKHKSKAI